MNRWFCFILILLASVLATDISYAAGMIYRVQQMKAQKSGQMTQEQYQQYQMQQEQQQAAQQQAAPPPSYQQTVDQRNQAIAQAILDAHNQSGANASVPFGNDPQLPETQQPNLVAGVMQPQSVNNQVSPTSGASDVVDLSEVWKKLDVKSKIWSALADDQAKVLTVSEYIDRFHKEGVKINEPPEHYVQMIDQIVGENPQMLERPFGELIQTVAIVDYDFDNGMNKDDLAKNVLGEAGYEANKRRIAQQQQMQQQQMQQQQQ